MYIPATAGELPSQPRPRGKVPIFLLAVFSAEHSLLERDGNKEQLSASLGPALATRALVTGKQSSLGEGPDRLYSLCFPPSPQ